MNAMLQKHKQYLLTGVSHVIPFIACGGILIALSLAYCFHFQSAGTAPWRPRSGYARALVYSGHIHHRQDGLRFVPSRAGRIHCLCHGGQTRVGSRIHRWAHRRHPADDRDQERVSAGFLGALIIGLVAGHVVNAFKKIPVAKIIRPIMPIIVIPILSAVPVGLLMLALNLPMAQLMVALNHGLGHMQSGSQVVLAMVLGAMIAFDMGGPVNKTAFFFGVAMIQQYQLFHHGRLRRRDLHAASGTCAGHAFSIARAGRRNSANQAWPRFGMGLVGITEGAIPFAAGDPIRVIPSIMLGSMVAATIAMLAVWVTMRRMAGRSCCPWLTTGLFMFARLLLARQSPLAINLLKTLTEKPAAAAADKSMKLVAVTACPTGIAHTYMAAEKLEKVAKKLGHTIKVETQGAMGIENELTQAEVDEADAAILATDIAH
jgi:fructose PTS system EIIBC or EIIC component